MAPEGLHGFADAVAHLAAAVQEGKRILIVGDFDADGRQDVVAANWSNDDVSVLLGNGDGSFAPQTRYPSGWDSLVKPSLDAAESISIYELHVRDFSAGDPSVPDALRGTYKAFTLDGSNGTMHLGALAASGARCRPSA